MLHHLLRILFFFFNDTATTEIYPLSLHDALPIPNSNFLLETEKGRYFLTIYEARTDPADLPFFLGLLSWLAAQGFPSATQDRKSTRLNSSHANISYAVFCLKKKDYTHQTSPLRIK